MKRTEITIWFNEWESMPLKDYQMYRLYINNLEPDYYITSYR